MFGDTNIEDLQSWERFCEAYHEPIQQAFRSIRGLKNDEPEEQAQEFWLKLIKKDQIAKWDGPRGTFRKYLYSSIRNHAYDYLRRMGRVPKGGSISGGAEPAVWDDDVPDEDSLYALGMLHLTLQKVRQHCEKTGLGEAWRVFDDLYVAPIMPDRTALSRDELLRDHYPGRDSQFLTNRCVTVFRTIRRMLPELIPEELSDRDRSGQRFAEWLQLLGQSDRGRQGRLHMALSVAPPLRRDASQELSIGMVNPEEFDAVGTDEDEMQLILSFRLDLPFESYLSEARLSASAAALTLRSLVEGTAELPRTQLLSLLDALKTWTKQIRTSPEHDLPDVFSQVLYNLALALALVRANGARITSLSDAQIETNLHWAIACRWVDERTRSVLRQALGHLGQARAG